MAGKGGKGLLAAKTTAANKDKDKDKDKKRPVSRSSRAGIQVTHLPSFCFYRGTNSITLIGILGEFNLLSSASCAIVRFCCPALFMFTRCSM